jgi:hypothetical protein
MQTRMEIGERSLGKSLSSRDYDWIDSFIGARTPAASEPGSPESVGVIVENDLVRTVLFTMLLGGLASLMAYFSIHVAAGQGRSIFLLTATLAAFLACGAVASRRRKLLRFVLVLGSLCALAVLVDQLVYYRWHQRAEKLVASLQHGFESGAPASPDPMKLQPTSFLVSPERGVLLTFEPPFLAWTHQLDSASPVGHTLIAGWYKILSRATRGRKLDRIAQTLVRPHEVYSVGVNADGGSMTCQEDGKREWTLSIASQP